MYGTAQMGARRKPITTLVNGNLCPIRCLQEKNNENEFEILACGSGRNCRRVKYRMQQHERPGHDEYRGLQGSGE